MPDIRMKRNNCLRETSTAYSVCRSSLSRRGPRMHVGLRGALHSIAECSRPNMVSP
jgi:hypothetical protein